MKNKIAHIKIEIYFALAKVFWNTRMKTKIVKLLMLEIGKEFNMPSYYMDMFK